MLKKLIALSALFLFVAASFGCSYNYSEVSPEASLNRLAIAGEKIRIAGRDLDRMFEMQKYPTLDERHY